MQYLDNIVDTYLLTPENSKFELKNNILYCEIPEKNFSARCFVARAFPFEKLDEYISVIDEDKEEKGMILKLSIFPEETRKMIEHELNVRYFSPKIKKIYTLNEKYGYSHWVCETDVGKMSFSLRDTYRSIIRIGENRAIIFDSDGSRFEIEDLSKLDKNSRSKLELYL